MSGILDRLRASPHRFCQDNLSAYIDGQLSPRGQERVRRHLDECHDCRWQLESLQRTVALLRSMPQARAPRSFAIPRTAPAPSLPVWMRPGAYAALRTATAAAAALFVIAMAGNALALPSPMLRAAQPAGSQDARTSAVSTMPAEAPMGALEAAGVPSPEGDTAGPLASAAATTTEPGMPAAGAPGEATLTPDEEQRKASAPPGKGGGEIEPTAEPSGTSDGRGLAGFGPTATPGGPPYGLGAGERTQPAPTPTGELVAPAAAAAPEPTAAPAVAAQGALPSQATVQAGETPEVGRGTALAQATAVPDAAQAAASGTLRARMQLAAHPWQALTIALAALAALLAAATLWLRSARSRWP